MMEQEEIKKLRSDVDRLFQIVEMLTDKTDRLSGIVGALAEQLPDIDDILTKRK